MSTWIEIKKQEDVELSDDGKTIDVLYNFDHNGNNYIEIPIEFLKCVLANVVGQSEQLVCDCGSHDVRKTDYGFLKCLECRNEWDLAN